jgi:hypothetical protein
MPHRKYAAMYAPKPEALASDPVALRDLRKISFDINPVSSVANSTQTANLKCRRPSPDRN